MKELKLPVALEKVLAFKDVRVSQVGMKPEDLERVEKGRYLFLMYSVCCMCPKKLPHFYFLNNSLKK